MAEHKAKWAPCLVAELMSSEDSNLDVDTDADGECEKSNTQFVVHPLPWRSEKAKSFFSLP